MVRRRKERAKKKLLSHYERAKDKEEKSREDSMKPIKFKEQTGILLKPHSMTDEECEPLPIHFTGDHYISCWKMSFKERIKGLLFGKIWLYVYSKISQPPVGMACDKTVFFPRKRRRGGCPDPFEGRNLR